MKYKCTTCEGEYNDTNDDGLAYYHACPPILDKDENYVERIDKRDENAGKKLEEKGRIKI